MFAKFLTLLCLFMSFFFVIEGGQHPKQNIPCTYEKNFDAPEAFEKVYIDPSMILSMPYGTFLKHRDGSHEKVQTLSEDYQGLYILRIKSQCQHCGKIYTGKDNTEGWNCMLYEKEIVHHVWCAP